MIICSIIVYSCHLSVGTSSHLLFDNLHLGLEMMDIYAAKLRRSW